jgi:hypothetical protein
MKTDTDLLRRLRSYVYPHSGNPEIFIGEAVDRIVALERQKADEKFRGDRYYGMTTEAEADANALREELSKTTRLLKRYLKETPLGNQPHMIALEASIALDAALAALGKGARDEQLWATCRSEAKALQDLIVQPAAAAIRALPSNDWLLERRIAHEGYPQSEARWGSIEEYVEFLESQHRWSVG